MSRRKREEARRRREEYQKPKRPGPVAPVWRDGHLSVHLSKPGKSEWMRVDHMVLTSFAGPCPPGMECKHLDGDPSNNALANLCWAPPSTTTNEEQA